MAPNTFACHESGVVKPALCAGFLLRNSGNNLGVRFQLMRDELDLPQVSDGGAELFSSYREMAVANGVDHDDPALAQCRADNE